MLSEKNASLFCRSSYTLYTITSCSWPCVDTIFRQERANSDRFLVEANWVGNSMLLFAQRISCISTCTP